MNEASKHMPPSALAAHIRLSGKIETMRITHLGASALDYSSFRFSC
jgi:hypothetical protein